MADLLNMPPEERRAFIQSKFDDFCKKNRALITLGGVMGELSEKILTTLYFDAFTQGVTEGAHAAIDHLKANAPPPHDPDQPQQG